MTGSGAIGDTMGFDGLPVTSWRHECRYQHSMLTESDDDG